MDPEEVGGFDVLLRPGVKIDEEQHVFAGALPELTFVKYYVSLEEGL